MFPRKRRNKSTDVPLQVDFKPLKSSNTAPTAQVAQLVEQRIENPRVGGSIPPLATTWP